MELFQLETQPISVSGVLFHKPQVTLEEVSLKIQSYPSSGLTPTQTRELGSLRNLEAQLSPSWNETCCSKPTCHGSSFTHERMNHFRRQVWQNHQQVDRSVAILELWTQGSCSLKPAKVFLDGKRVCLAFFVKVLGVSDSGLRKLVNRGLTQRRLPARTSNPAVLEYLRSQRSLGNFDPTTNTVRSIFSTKKLVYEDFCELNPLASVSRSNFMRIWKTFCSDLKVARSTGLLHCSVCTEMLELLRGTRSTNQRLLIKSRYQAHLNMVKEERSLYENKKERAALEPNKFLSLTIDGADQKNFQNPHFLRLSKTNSEFPHLSAVGVIVHSRESFLYTFFKNISHDSNCTVECLQRTLYVLFGGKLEDFVEDWFKERLTTIRFPAESCETPNRGSPRPRRVHLRRSGSDLSSSPTQETSPSFSLSDSCEQSSPRNETRSPSLRQTQSLVSLLDFNFELNFSTNSSSETTLAEPQRSPLSETSISPNQSPTRRSPRLNNSDLERSPTHSTTITMTSTPGATTMHRNNGNQTTTTTTWISGPSTRTRSPRTRANNNRSPSRTRSARSGSPSSPTSERNHQVQNPHPQEGAQIRVPFLVGEVGHQL